MSMTVCDCPRCFGTGGSYDVTADDEKGLPDGCPLCLGTGLVSQKVNNAWAMAWPRARLYPFRSMLPRLSAPHTEARDTPTPDN